MNKEGIKEMISKTASTLANLVKKNPNARQIYAQKQKRKANVNLATSAAQSAGSIGVLGLAGYGGYKLMTGSPDKPKQPNQIKTARFTDEELDRLGIPIESKPKRRLGVPIENVGTPIEPRLPVENLGIPLKNNTPPMRMNYSSSALPIDAADVGIDLSDLKPAATANTLPWLPANDPNPWFVKKNPAVKQKGKLIQKLMRSVL